MHFSSIFRDPSLRDVFVIAVSMHSGQGGVMIHPEAFIVDYLTDCRFWSIRLFYMITFWGRYDMMA